MRQTSDIRPQTADTRQITPHSSFRGYIPRDRVSHQLLGYQVTERWDDTGISSLLSFRPNEVSGGICIGQKRSLDSLHSLEMTLVGEKVTRSPEYWRLFNVLQKGYVPIM